MSREESPEAAATKPIRHVEEIINGARTKRYVFTPAELDRYFDGQDPYSAQPSKRRRRNTDDGVDGEKTEKTGGGGDILTRLCRSTELAIELGKHMDADAIVSLYSISRAFHHAVDGYMSASVRAWIAHKAPLAGQIFDPRLYRRHLVADPAGRTWSYQYETDADAAAAPSPDHQDDDDDDGGDRSFRDGGGGEGEATRQTARRRRIDAAKAGEIRTIPGLVYLQLVTSRDRCCREIRAVLARNGHRLPPRTAHATLLKLWLLMDLGTSAQRAALVRNPALWSDADLYNAQLLFVKLAMHFNDPVYGPSSHDLLRLILGQRGGLRPLWELLLRKRFTTLHEVLALRVRYDMQVPSMPGGGGEEDGGGGDGGGRAGVGAGNGGVGGGGGGGQGHWTGEYFGTSIHGVPYAEIGRGHLEGWGRITDPRNTTDEQRHLLRPDELIPLEAVTRGLRLDDHLVPMMLWGLIDWRTGANLVPPAAELHLDPAALAHADTTHHWRARHALKARFHLLPAEQQARIRAEDEDDRLRAMAWCGDVIDDYYSSSSSSSSEDEYSSINEEMTRGFIVPPRHEDEDGGEGGGKPPPEVGDEAGWREFVNDVILSGLPPDVGAEEALRAEAWQTYHDSEMGGDVDWAQWLQNRERERVERERERNDADADDGTDAYSDDDSHFESDSGASTVLQ